MTIVSDFVKIVVFRREYQLRLEPETHEKIVVAVPWQGIKPLHGLSSRYFGLEDVSVSPAELWYLE